MLNSNAKSAFFIFARPFMWINGLLYRTLRAQRSGFIKVHLGPGQKNYLQGWINLDANIFTGKCDVWVDLRNRLPFNDSSVDAFYSHHVIEHLPNLDFHFEDVCRCLKPGGVYRVGAPNGDSAITKFMDGDKLWFGDWPVNRKSIGGRFENFVFCKGEHLTVVTYTFIHELMGNAGFVDINSRLPIKETGFPEFFTDCLGKENESDFITPHTLIVEGQKIRL